MMLDNVKHLFGTVILYCDINIFVISPRFALEMNRDHSLVFEIASKYCILNSFVNYNSYSIPSKEILPRVVDIMVIHPF